MYIVFTSVEVELVQLLLQNNYNPNYPQNCSDIISVTIDGRTTSVDMSPLHLAMYQVSGFLFYKKNYKNWAIIIISNYI